VSIKHLRGTLLSALIITSIIALSIPLLSSRPVHAAFLTSHNPIYINGNAGFTKPDPVNGGGSGTASDPYIIENWIINALDYGIDIEGTTADFAIRNCLIENRYFSNAGISFSNVINGKIENCTFNNIYIGIDLYNSSNNNTISSNTFENNSYGIFSDHSSNNDLSNNTLRNNGNGFFFQFANNNIISNNTVIGYGGDGLYFSESYNNLISSNACEKNFHGISFSGHADYNTISSNTFENNSYGIYFNYASNNTLTSNTVRNNSYGIYLILLSSNHNYNNNIYHNNIINNITQVTDLGSNIWDNGYPSGGNYWSDYTGVDANGDGIGDTPYSFPGPGGSNQDRYPLMSPWSPPPSAILTVTATKVDSTHYNLRISHDGGDDLSVNDIEIQASDSSTTMATYAFPGTGTFSVGMNAVLTCTYSPDCTNQYVTVHIIHKPSNQKIFTSSIILVQSPPPAPVGGIAFAPNKLALLAPYIVLAALIAIAGLSVAVYWRRRYKT
jgi:parallel beta-helix repeat protein